MDWATVNMAAFVAAFFILGRALPAADRRVIDVIMVNWVVGALLWAPDHTIPLGWWMANDFLAGLWLLACVPGRVATWAGLCFAPMILLNAAQLITGHADPALWINILGWLQLVVIVWGAWGDEMGRLARRWFDPADRLHRGGRAGDAGGQAARQAAGEG